MSPFQVSYLTSEVKMYSVLVIEMEGVTLFLEAVLIEEEGSKARFSNGRVFD